MRMMQEVLRGGGTYNDVVRRAERFTASPQEQFMAVSRDRAFVAKGAMPQLTMDEIEAGRGIDAARLAEARRRRFEVEVADVKDDEGESLWSWLKVQARPGAMELANRGTLGGYEQMTVDSAAWGRFWQSIGTGVAELNATLSTSARAHSEWLEQINRSVIELREMDQTLKDIEKAVDRLKDR